jgi:hypothetical protein
MKKVDVELVYVVTNPDGKEVTLREGDKVALKTDKTEFAESYSGQITFLNEDQIELDYSETIPWEYVVEVSLL